MKSGISINEIQIHIIKPVDGIVAFASCVVNKSLYLSSIAIHVKLDGSGYRLTYPTKSTGGKNLNTFHPVNKETSHKLEEAIIAKFLSLIQQHENDRHY